LVRLIFSESMLQTGSVPRLEIGNASREGSILMIAEQRSRQQHRQRGARGRMFGGKAHGEVSDEQGLKAPEEFVEFIGGVEVGLQVAGGQAFAKIVEAACEEIEGGGENFFVGQHDVAPGGVGAAG
jgi:hypothetical protein